MSKTKQRVADPSRRRGNACAGAVPATKERAKATGKAAVKPAAKSTSAAKS